MEHFVGFVVRHTAVKQQKGEKMHNSIDSASGKICLTLHNNPYQRSRVTRACGVFFATILWLASTGGAHAEDLRWTIGLDTGEAWQSRNDVQISNDTGTRFSIGDIAGTGPFPFYRLELTYNMKPRHSLRFLFAPFEYTETGILDKDVIFVDQSFSGGKATEVTYRFNSYRATYRYRFYEGARWQWRVGITAKIRDAEIALKQEGRSAKDSNVGIVPLLNLYGVHEFTHRWRLIIDFDGLAAPQGRAVELGLSARYDVAKRWYVGAGYRTLEGGADNAEVYNFAWFHYAFLSAGYSF